MQKLLLVYYHAENRATSQIWKVLPNMVFPPIWGEKMAAFWACACKLSWTLLSPARVQPLYGAERKESSGTGLIRSKTKINRDSLDAFSRALRQLPVITSSFDWFNILCVFSVIGLSNYFGFGFTTLNWKPLKSDLIWPLMSRCVTTQVNSRN